MYPKDRQFSAERVYLLLRSLRKTAQVLQVSHTTIARWIKCKDQKFSTKRKSPKSELIKETLRYILLSSPFSTLKTIKKILLETLNVVVSKQLILNAMSEIRFSRKKARYVTKSKNQDERVRDFLTQREILKQQNRTWYSLDETAFGRNCKSEYGYSPIGQRLNLERDVKRLQSISAMVLISNDSVCKYSLSSSAYSTESFYEFLISFDFPPNAVLLLDNVRFHHSKLIKEYAEMVSLTLLYTPPYSPWFNPIEGVFSIVKKHYYRNSSIDDAMQNVTVGHLKSFFRHSMRLLNGDF